MKTIFSLCFALLSSQGVFSGGGSSSSGSRSYEYSYERHGDQHHDYAYRHSTFCKRELSSLRLLIGVFRHGDKTPDTTFPTDIYQDESWPNGFGQLTMGGVERSFELGRWMRFCYDSFLHKRVSPKRLYVRSSDYDRTLQSAQAVLAGAYPPTASYQIGSVRFFFLFVVIFY